MICLPHTLEIRRHERNWRNPFKLMVATLIICRMYELNVDADIAVLLAKRLLKFRSIAIGWVRQIKETIENGQFPEMERNNLHANLMDAAICGTFTYFISQNHNDFDKIFGMSGEDSAMFAWLQFIETINHNNFLCRNSPQVRLVQLFVFAFFTIRLLFSFFFCMTNKQRQMRELLLRISHTIALSVERKMDEEITNDPEKFKEFVCTRYSRAAKGNFNELRHLRNKRHSIEVEVKIESETFRVQMDYVFGAFLVDGLPTKRLPETITQHQIFRRIFGNMTFEVQPGEGTFTTVSAHNGSNYIFREDKLDGVIIIEHNVDSVEYISELIPHTKLNGLVSLSLVEHYSHWYNRENNKIEFRPKLFSDARFGTAEGLQYELDLHSLHLKHMKSTLFLLDVQSTSFKRIADSMRRLENPGYILVLMDAPYKAVVRIGAHKIEF